MSGGVLIFDMDGVLVDVGESYREAICQTVGHFTGRPITREQVQAYKNHGGWNNDWALSQKIAADLGVTVPYETVIAHFQRLFLGNGDDGLILRERWLPGHELLERLAIRYQLAVFTGRPRAEAGLTLRRFGVEEVFSPVIGADDVVRGKPAPDGLLRIGELCPGSRLWYVGDTVDDLRSARAAGVPFIGVAAAGSHRRDELVDRFTAEGAIAVVENVNQLPEALER